MVKKLIVFDLDGTLAASKSSLDAEMAISSMTCSVSSRLRSSPEALGSSLKSRCSPIFRRTNA